MTSKHNKQTSQDSNASSSSKVHFSESSAYKYMSGVRKPISSRRDTGLYGRYKQVAKAVYGSVCRADELYMVALIEAVEKGVHFSNTERPIKIERIVIERNLRPRRKLEIELCGHADCDEVTVGVGVWRGRIRLPLCEKHLAEAMGSPDWKILTENPGVGDV